MSDHNDRLSRARGYPYPIPEGSYLWRGGEVLPFDPAKREGRTAVLAIGSNQSPQQLTRKFGAAGEIPVQRARLRDFDIYYSAHITGYGSVPAMLQRAQGAEVTLSVNWLDAAQLDLMHGTELHAAKYRYEVIEDIELALDCGMDMDFVHLYVGVNGHLVHDGEAVALAAMPAAGRRPKALTTAEVLEIVRQRFAPGYGSDEFVLKLVEDADFRADCTGAISVDSVPFGHPSRPARALPGPAGGG